MQQLDIFTYPMRAGFKANGTSRDAADAIEVSGKAGSLIDAVTDWFNAGNEGTADECAAALCEDINNIRPRLSQLRGRELLVDTGTRRRATGGRMATVWRLA